MKGERERERENERKRDWERSRRCTARIETRGESVTAKSLDDTFKRGTISNVDIACRTKEDKQNGFSSKIVSFFARSSLECKDRKRHIILF